MHTEPSATRDALLCRVRVTPDTPTSGLLEEVRIQLQERYSIDLTEIGTVQLAEKIREVDGEAIYKIGVQLNHD